MTFHRVDYGTTAVNYELIFSRRKTLGITVYPDGRVVVRAPLGASEAEVQDLVRKKGGWIVKKQQMFEDYPPPPPPRRYVSGESHLYLGREYRLKVVQDSRQSVTLTGDRFLLHVRDSSDLSGKQKLMTEWYRARAREVFAERLDACYVVAQRHGIPFPEMKIRLMKKRWGSCSSKGNINLNLRLIQTPQSCIDYVIFHELAHLRVLNHSAAFYALLAKMLPDWRERRESLNKVQVA